MLDFVIMLKDTVPDQEEMFGIFSKVPEKVMILPGLQPVFNSFIQAVIDYKKTQQPSQKRNTKVPTSTQSPKRVLQKKKGKPDVQKLFIDIEQLREQMRKWLLKHDYREDFNIEETSSTGTFLFTCGSCFWKAHLTNSNGKQSPSLSNIQRHYSSNRCENLVKKNTKVEKC